MEHYNGILFHKSGLANKQHTNQSIKYHSTYTEIRTQDRSRVNQQLLPSELLGQLGKKKQKQKTKKGTVTRIKFEKRGPHRFLLINYCPKASKYLSNV